MPKVLVPVLPFDALAEEIGGNDSVLAQHLGVTRRQVQRYRRDGVTVRSADLLACRAGLHPLIVWGEAWTEAELEAARLQRDSTEEYREGRNARRRARKAENRAWRQMESRWAQWAAQQDRNRFEASQRHTG